MKFKTVIGSMSFTHESQDELKSEIQVEMKKIKEQMSVLEEKINKINLENKPLKKQHSVLKKALTALCGGAEKNVEVKEEAKEEIPV